MVMYIDKLGEQNNPLRPNSAKNYRPSPPEAALA